MKKTAAAIMAMIMIIVNAAYATPKSARMTVTVRAKMVENHQVGNEWSVECMIGEKALFVEEKDAKDKKSEYIKNPQKENEIGSEKITVEAGRLVITTTVTEYDKDYPDEGIDVTERTVTAAELRSGFEVTVTMTVIENAGRYKGNAAKWEIVYEFKP